VPLIGKSVAETLNSLTTTRPGTSALCSKVTSETGNQTLAFARKARTSNLMRDRLTSVGYLVDFAAHLAMEKYEKAHSEP